MKAFRIALQRYGATAKAAFSGVSGFSADGRWHSKGRYLDYAAESQSLAVLERLVHYKRFDALETHVLFLIEIPDSFIQTCGEPPKGWDAPEPLPAAQTLGNQWCDERRSPVLKVPSAVTRGEFNVMLNSKHPAWDWGWIAKRQPFALDGRLRELLRATGKKR